MQYTAEYRPFVDSVGQSEKRDLMVRFEVYIIKMSIHTTSRVSCVASFIGLGLWFTVRVSVRPAVCIYVECLYTQLRARLAVCIASVIY